MKGPSIIEFVKDVSRGFVQRCPSRPLHVHAKVSNSLGGLGLAALATRLPNTLKLFTQKRLARLASDLLHKKSVALRTRAGSLGFISALTRKVRVPCKAHLRNGFAVTNAGVNASLLLVRPRTRTIITTSAVPVAICGSDVSMTSSFGVRQTTHLFTGCSLSHSECRTSLTIGRFSLRRFVPTSSLCALSAHLGIRKRNFSFFSPHACFGTRNNVSHFRCNDCRLAKVSLTTKLRGSGIRTSLTIGG